MIEKLERLAAAGIQLLPTDQIETHFVFERDGLVALVERRPDGFGAIGAPGMLTEAGIAMLIWRGERGFFVAKNFEQPATDNQIQRLRKFDGDLKTALR
ncbi:MAG: hypothetical protein ACRD8O_03960 [Bryobacteraceae bacterium]